MANTADRVYTKRKGIYFLKDKKAQIFKKYEMGRDADGFGGGTAYVAVAAAPLWCYARQLSEEQLYYAASFQENETRMFVFNFRDDVEMYDVVEYRGEYYSITRVDTQEDYNGELFIYCGKTSIESDAEFYPAGTDTSNWERIR